MSGGDEVSAVLLFGASAKGDASDDAVKWASEARLEAKELRVIHTRCFGGARF
jgi:hypothetical protein